MENIPAATRQEGTQAQSVDLDLQLYWRDCQHEGERLLTVYRRATMNRSYSEQYSVLQRELLKYKDLVPRMRELITAVDQELLSLNRFTDSDRKQYTELLHYRTGLVSLWEIVSPYLLTVRNS